ncbi:hypothetical protein ABZW18_00190 [Streptomyces sp. NPDC004647]|uniref:hypothetical protein n=1 Tax=Streptomyces sp. NPDC004647 TaxID=3154671 RepID=UPI0033A3B6B8
MRKPEEQRAGLFVAAHAADACAARGYAFQVAGGLALAAHRATERATYDINLTSEHPFDPVQAREAIAGRLLQLGYQVADDDGVARRGVTGRLKVTLPGAGPVNVDLAQMPQSQDTVMLWGRVPVAGLADCVLRTLQAVRGRSAVQDYLDVVTLERHLGPEQFDRITFEFLQHEAARLQPGKRRVPFMHLHERLLLVMHQPVRRFEHYGCPARQAEGMRDAVVTIASRNMASAPGVDGKPSIFSLPRKRLETMRAEMLATLMDDAYGADTNHPDVVAGHQTLERTIAYLEGERLRREAQRRLPANPSPRHSPGHQRQHHQPGQQSPGGAPRYP